jgi:gas vesicle protein
MNEENIMKYVLVFLLGALSGAVAALLFAPSSGEELRANIKTQADAQAAKLQSEYQKGMKDMNARIDQLSSQLQASRSKQPMGQSN